MTGLVFVKLDKTHEARPARWEAWDTAGNVYSIRYRFGTLRVYKETITGLTEIHTQRIGHGLDGELATEAMLEAIGATTL